MVCFCKLSVLLIKDSDTYRNMVTTDPILNVLILTDFAVYFLNWIQTWYKMIGLFNLSVSSFKISYYKVEFYKSVISLTF